MDSLVNIEIEACHIASTSISMSTCKQFTIDDTATHMESSVISFCPKFCLSFSYDAACVSDILFVIIRFLKGSDSTLPRPRKHKISGMQQIQKALTVYFE
jgi:hypothetical protein